ncbi:unnamed protein product [Amoebophrya sp. A120]|nr:unnamed protein product [Amoebophrya sp. A120]|eukprot:GSA120T00015691001.1
MIGSPGKIAKARYQDAFDSDIFAAPARQQQKAYPAGYRRDQNTAELFGEEVFARDLKKQQGTFEPRADPLSPRRKKLHFLQGGSVPETNQQDFERLQGYGQGRAQVGFTDDTDHIDHGSHPVVRRHQELESHIFPSHAKVNAEETQGKYQNNKITPHCFNWFNSEPVAKPPPSGATSSVTHQDRAYAEKASHLFEHETPLPPSLESQRENYLAAMSQESEDLRRRKANQYYSDLFGRETPATGKDALAAYHPKPLASPEAKIAVHGEWTDARTNARSDERPMTAKERQFRELYRTEVPESGARDYNPVDSEVAPIATDTSSKVKRYLYWFHGRLLPLHS